MAPLLPRVACKRLFSRQKQSQLRVLSPEIACRLATMKERLKCPKCEFTLSSSRTHEYKDTKLVGCKKCGMQSSLGEWRSASLSFATPFLRSPKQASGVDIPSELPPPLPNIGTAGLDDINPTFIPYRESNGEHKPLPSIEIGVVATTESSLHKKMTCPKGHCFQVKTTEEGKQVLCPECGMYLLVPKTSLLGLLVGVIVILAVPVMLCAGCLSMLSDSTPRTNSSYNSVNSDMDKFNRHFPNASSEERKLTQELFEQDSRSRGY